MDILKSFIVTILVLAGFYWWIREGTDDPDYVTIEYQCSELDKYAQVPDEVIEECAKRLKQNEPNKIQS
jgi:hypothetical protein